MKKSIITMIAVALLALPAVAQKYACVNTDYVLRSIPDYGSAQKRLDKYVADWQKELADKAAELDEMRADFEQESYLLPDNLKKRRQEEIRAKEQEIRDLQRQRFGAGGDLDRKRAELMKPIQDRVYNTIERVAQEKNYAFVFDKSASATLLYASKKYDISDEVLELLGYKPGAATEQQQKDDKAQEKGKKPTNPEMRQPANERVSRNVMPPMGAVKNK
ncbi:MAG: OmpH family outer membrane protein [Bacteroidales bacterium]|nr:OmpH family outer membrane protein [Bacteroidales bacterium]